jgi:hypothetical protein
MRSAQAPAKAARKVESLDHCQLRSLFRIGKQAAQLRRRREEIVFTQQSPVECRPVHLRTFAGPAESYEAPRPLGHRFNHSRTARP